MNEEFTITRANREAGPVTISIAGMSGSGKTYSGLLLARGLVGPQGKIVLIDTEGRRALIYADDPDIGGFEHLDMRPPFSSNRTREAIQAAVDFGAECIIIDSASHEHDGEGGMLDFANSESARIIQTQKDRGKPYKDPGFQAWIKPKMAHKKYVQAILGAPAHMIITLRQHEVTVVDAKKQGGRVGDKVVSTICDSQLVFEMTLAVILNAQYQPTYVKCPKPLQSAIRQGEPLTIEHGRLLAGEAGHAAPEPYTIYYPGGKGHPCRTLEEYADTLRSSASKAGVHLEEFKRLNEAYVLGRIAGEDEPLASLLIDTLSTGGA